MMLMVLWFSIMILMIYLTCNIIRLTKLKEKILQDKLQEIIQERNYRKAKKTYQKEKRVEEENNA